LLQDEEAHHRSHQQQVEALTSKVARLEEALRTTTTDYIVTRRDKQAAQARATEVDAEMAAERKKAATKVCNRWNAVAQAAHWLLGDLGSP
jgi:hypothetical protein